MRHQLIKAMKLSKVANKYNLHKHNSDQYGLNNIVEVFCKETIKVPRRHGTVILTMCNNNNDTVQQR